jgi:radical SAM superfamily enzyme YgiQ (UPF0313 family)
MSGRVFKVVLIVPSHYDADGYVIQWWRSLIPSNSLAVLYAIVNDCARQQVLGAQTRIEIDAYDESNRRINVKRLVRKIHAAGAGFVGLVGVQTSQYPRAVDLGRQFRAAGIPVVIGGFHVTGSLAMFADITHELQEALNLGISLFAGEAESRMADLLRDVDRGQLKRIYNYVADLPGLEGAPQPFLPREVTRRVVGVSAAFDAGRGCPFQCSFCTIINVQGRKSRFRTADDIEAIIRRQRTQSDTFFITDDNFARNANWEAIFDRLIHLRERDGFDIRLIFQVDTLCHRIPGFIEKAVRAGCVTIFIGLESLNPESLMVAKKRQNKIWEYRNMLLAWKRAGVMVFAGYILGFPNDTPASIAHDIELVKRELPIDVIEFFVLTPLPGSEDHKKLRLAGVAMDPDLNKYDAEHVCVAHDSMTKEEWASAYDNATALYYSDQHVETIIRRAIKSSDTWVIKWLCWFAAASRIEGVHPLQVGIFRRKIRTDRRPGFPRVSPLIFYPRRLFEVAKTNWQWIRQAWHYHKILRRLLADPSHLDDSDAALRPVTEDQLVKAFAGKIPKTYGAPRSHVASS